MAALRIEVSDELERRLHEGAERQGIPLSDYVRPALEALTGIDTANGQEPPVETSQSPALTTGESILAMFEDAWKDVPAEEWQHLPSDLAENHDHYLYGTPKKNP